MTSMYRICKYIFPCSRSLLKIEFRSCILSNPSMSAVEIMQRSSLFGGQLRGHRRYGMSMGQKLGTLTGWRLETEKKTTWGLVMKSARVGWCSPELKAVSSQFLTHSHMVLRSQTISDGLGPKAFRSKCVKSVDLSWPTAGVHHQI